MRYHVTIVRRRFSPNFNVTSCASTPHHRDIAVAGELMGENYYTDPDNGVIAVDHELY